MTFSFWLSTSFATPQGQIWKCSISCCKTVAKRITDTLMTCNSFSTKRLNAAFQDRQAWKQVLETLRFNSSVFIGFIRPSKRPLLPFFCSIEHTNMDGVRVTRVALLFPCHWVLQLKKYSSLEVVFITLRILFSNALVKAFSGEVRFPVRRPLLIFWLKCGAQMHKDDIYWRYVLRRLPTYSKNVTTQEIVVIMVRAAKKENERG